MYARVALRVKVAIREVQSLVPPVLCKPLLVTKQCDNTALVIDVGSLANKGVLHLVDVFLEVLLILTSEQLFDAL